jgi:cytidyltransferase-like protein
LLPFQTICKPAPYSTDPEAVAERDACDYTQRITVDMAKNGTCTRKIRIYTDGIYDLFHQGHARQMMQAKNIFPNSQVYLIIGACNDEVTHSLKGRTVMTDVERFEAIRHCRYVDEIIRDAPWKITDEFMEKHKIDFVAQDSTPYVTDDCDDLYRDIKEKGYFVATERTEGELTEKWQRLRWFDRFLLLSRRFHIGDCRPHRQRLRLVRPPEPATRLHRQGAQRVVPQREEVSSAEQDRRDEAQRQEGHRRRQR